MTETRWEGGETEGVHMADGHTSIYVLKKNDLMETAFVCCDCGLVHLVEIEHDEDEVRFTWHRGEAITQEFRDKASKERASVLSSQRVGDEFSRMRQKESDES